MVITVAIDTTNVHIINMIITLMMHAVLWITNATVIAKLLATTHAVAQRFLDKVAEMSVSPMKRKKLLLSI